MNCWAAGLVDLPRAGGLIGGSAGGLTSRRRKLKDNVRRRHWRLARIALALVNLMKAWHKLWQRQSHC